MTRFTSLALVLALFSACAFGATLTMTYEQVNDKIYQQTSNNPCVISDGSQAGQDKGSCAMPAAWPDPRSGTGGNPGSYDLSTDSIFTVGDIRAILGDFFIIALDVNETSTPQVLTILTVTGVNNVADLYQITQAEIAGGNISPSYNGNGFADYLFRPAANTPFSIQGLDASQVVTFRLALNPANDGGEQLFLLQSTGTGQVIPEPSTYALLGAGLLALGLFRRKRIQ